MASFRADEFKMTVKDRLRDLRFAMREITPHGVAPGSLDAGSAGALRPHAAGLAGTIAGLSENALQTVEKVGIGLLSSDPQAHFGAAGAYSFERYTLGRPAAAQTRFARDCYFAAKQVLRSKDCRNFRVSEELMARAYRVAAGSWRDGAARRSSSAAAAGLQEVARDAAIMALAIAQVRPVQFPLLLDPDGEGRAVDANVYVASALGLATGVATFHGGALSAADPIYAGVCAAVDARYGLIRDAVSGEERPEPLQLVFAELIPHLP